MILILFSAQHLLYTRVVGLLAIERSLTSLKANSIGLCYCEPLHPNSSINKAHSLNIHDV